MKAPTKRALNAKMIMYRKKASDRLNEAKAIDSYNRTLKLKNKGLEQEIKELYKDLTDAQNEIFRLSKIGVEDPLAKKGNPKYDVTIHGKHRTGSCIVDAYRVIDACSVVNPQLQHRIKKALFTGKRGHKDERQDLVDILDSAQSALDMFDDKDNLKGR